MIEEYKWEKISFIWDMIDERVLHINSDVSQTGLWMYQELLKREKEIETYIVIDPEQGTEEEFTDLDKAIAFANETCQDHLDESWDEAVENITISKLLYRSTKCDVKLKSDYKWDENEQDYIHPNGEVWQ